MRRPWSDKTPACVRLLSTGCWLLLHLLESGEVEADLDIEQEKSMLRNASLATHACTLIDGAIESAIAEVAGPPRGFMFANALPPPVKLCGGGIPHCCAAAGPY